MGGTHSFDLTIDQFLNDYSRKRKIDEDHKPRLFAICTVDNIVSRYVKNSYKAKDIFADGQNDTGIDGLAIIVNDQLVTSLDDIERIISEDRVLSTRFVFVQATMDREFREQKMTAFAHGVWKFFHPDDLGPRNDHIAHATKLKDALFEKSHWMHSGRPELHMYYLSAGRWKGDTVLEGTVVGAEALLEGTNLFKNVSFTPLDFRGFLDLRRNQQQRNTGELHSYRLRELPQMRGVSLAFLGAILVDDLIGIVRHPVVDRINRNVFLENVRGFQGGDNIVNFGINDTLKRDDPTIFPLLNNGITIVCRDHELAGPKLRIFGYQIVNGCQTSTVIFENRRKLRGRDILVPAKIVVTRDEKVVESIIRASNSQTKVTEEQMLSLLPFNRRLSEYYRAVVLNNVGERLYFDLRQGEFSEATQIDEIRIIQIRDQIQNFASMFLEHPHDAIDRLKAIRDEIPARIFNPDHALDPYYTASLAMYCFHRLRREHVIDAIFDNYRFQFLHVLRKKLFPKEFDLENWRAAPILCNEANALLLNENTSKELYAEAGEVIRAAGRMLDEHELRRESASRKAFTEAIDEVMRKTASKSAPFPRAMAKAR